MEVDVTGEFRSALIRLRGRLNEPATSIRPMPASRRRAILGQIESAFQRLDEGTYGICRNCLLIMPRGQLLMQPYAEVCTDCRSRKAA